ncbi:MAG: YfhL family 4Fe-4S dicluster ferredoxin [Desulfobacterales bacterium]|nr:YfhL family 4Fe-4S dicluster ferredoxin [Desulfobacterales bacterium]
MSCKIPEDCIFCGTCAEECPNGAIYEGEVQFHVDPEKCTECVGCYERPRCIEACPLELPLKDPDHQETREALLAKWRKLNPGKEPNIF